jgi:hypothetical protein
LLRFAGKEGCGVAPECTPVARPVRQHGTPSRIAVTEKGPYKTPDEVGSHDVTQRDMYLLEQDLAACREP